MTSTAIVARTPATKAKGQPLPPKGAKNGLGARASGLFGLGRRGSSAKPARASGESPAPKPATGPKVEGGAAITTSPAPAESWATIKVGNVVLATEGAGEGWFEAVVREITDDGRHRLGWRDWPKEPEFFRARDELALLPPGYSDRKAKKNG